MELEFVEGMQFDKGYISPYFVTDQENMESVLDEPYIAVVNKKISSVQEMLPLLEKVLQAGKPLLIIAEDIEGEALATLVVNKIRGTFNAVARQGARLRRPPQGDAPGHRDPHRRAGDLRGGRPQARERHARPARAARRVIVKKDDTTIVEGSGNEDDVKGRIGQIKAEIEKTDSDWDREKLQERLAKLAGGVAIVKVGAATEVELKEKKHRIEDALSATRAAIEEGIVPGGGVALIRAESALDKLDLTGDEATGAKIVRDSLVEPARLIADNAGVRGRGHRRADPHRGRHPRLQRRHRRVGGHVQGGIIDPAKVTRSALQNAASIAAIILTAESAVVEKPRRRSPRPPAVTGTCTSARSSANERGAGPVGPAPRRSYRPGFVTITKMIAT